MSSDLNKSIESIESSVKYIINQSPPDTNDDKIKDLLLKFNNDKGKVISYLWNPEIFDEKPKKEKTKIEQAREISIAFDNAKEQFEKNKNKN